MNRLLPLLLLVSLVVFSPGCRRRSQTAAPSTPPADTATPTPANPSGSAAPVANASALPATQNPPAIEVDRLPTAPPGSSRTLPTNLPLTEALQRHMEATGKFPSDFNALVTGKYISSLPQPPAGKRFAVDRANLQVVIIGQ